MLDMVAVFGPGKIGWQAKAPNAAYFVVQSDLWHSPSKPEHVFTGLFRRLWV